MLQKRGYSDKKKKRTYQLDMYQTRSSKDECSTGSNNHLRSVDILFIEFNRLKDLDDSV